MKPSFPASNPKFFDMRSLAVRLTTAIVGLLLVSNAGITILAINRKRHAFEEDLQVQAEILIEALEVAASKVLHGDDITHLDNLLRAVDRESSLVLGGRIFDANGLAVFDPYNAIDHEMGPDLLALEILVSNEMLFEWRNDRVVAGRKVMGGDDTLVITLELSTADLHAKISKALWQGFQAVIVSIAAGTLIALAIARSISLPLRAMVQATQKIAAGDLQQRLQEQGGTELATLSRGFNQMTKQLHINLLRKGAILHYALDPIITLDEMGKIEEFNDAAERVFGYLRSSVFGRDFTELIVAEPWQQSFKAGIAGCSAGESSDLLERWHEIRAMRSDGQEFPADFSVSCVAVEGVKLFTVMVRDVTERKRMEEQLRNEARHDPLTGLSNRSVFNRCLEQAFQHFKQDADAGFAVLFLDFDRFKFINDSLGHKIGDLLLVNIARRLQACVRPGDRIARLGGDEFTVLLENVNDAEFAEHIAQLKDLREAHGARHELETVKAAARFGAVLASHDDTTEEQVA
ncbi:MAG: diguanylate cyclase, partial [Cyanobacteria bacterium P01_E01_bin.34]